MQDREKKENEISEPDDAKEYNFEEEQFRSYGNRLDTVIKVIAVAWAVFQIYTAAFGLFPALIQRSVALGFALLLAFLRYPTGILKNDQDRLPIIDIIFIIGSIACTVYLLFNFNALAYRSGTATMLDIAMGVIAILLVIESTRRTVGTPLVLVAVTFLIYAYFGPYMPTVLGHRGYSIARLASHLYTTTEGIFGVPMYVMSTYIFAFILFGSFLEATGGSKLFINLAYAIAGSSKGGPAKTAIIASGFMGTISGSSLANVVTTGSFTIPLMKRVGYKPSFAAGVEAAASSGGQIMPPIMGAAAFIMAEMTGIPYLEIIKAAFLPAILYFASILIMVHLEADRINLKPTPREDLPDLKGALISALPLLFPIFTIVGLLVSGYSPLKAALYSTVVMILLASLQKETRLSLEDFIAGLERAAYNSVAVTAACAICGVIIGVVTLTGLGLKLAQVILLIAGGKLLPTLLLTMVASILLGMGLPTTAKYIVLAAIAAPALVRIGVPLMAAHLFIFYFGVVAEVTPPVALTSYAAAGVANSPGVDTALNGFRMSFAAFLVPFLFIYNNNLLLMDITLTSLILTTITSFVGMICLGAGLIGYFKTDCRLYERVLLVAAAIALVFHGMATNIAGIIVLVGIYFLQKRREPIENTSQEGYNYEG